MTKDINSQLKRLSKKVTQRHTTNLDLANHRAEDYPQSNSNENLLNPPTAEDDSGNQNSRENLGNEEDQTF